MKDLKHIHFYEKLLDEANNELVQKEKANGIYMLLCSGSFAKCRRCI